MGIPYTLVKHETVIVTEKSPPEQDGYGTFTTACCTKHQLQMFTGLYFITVSSSPAFQGLANHSLTTVSHHSAVEVHKLVLTWMCLAKV